MRKHEKWLLSNRKVIIQERQIWNEKDSSEQLPLAQLHWLIADEYDEMNMINNFNIKYGG